MGKPNINFADIPRNPTFYDMRKGNETDTPLVAILPF